MDGTVVPEGVRRICTTLRRNGRAAYLVGGGVRDALLGRTPKDWDVATDAPPEEVLSLFPRTVPTGLAFGTVTVLLDDEASDEAEGGRRAVEVTTFRGEEGYGDGRRPDAVRFIGRIEDDLVRRDFTVNAIAYDPEDGRLVDPHGGRDDLVRRRLRAVGDPDARFEEDGLRVMRAVRLATELAFDIEPDTGEALGRHAGALEHVSRERIGEEWRRMLASDAPGRGLRLLRSYGLLPFVFVPDTKAARLQDPLALERTARALDRSAAGDDNDMDADTVLAIRTALVMHGVGAPPDCRRCLGALVYPNHIGRPTRALTRAFAALDGRPPPDDGELRRCLGRLGRPHIPAFVAAWRSWRPDAEGEGLAARIERIVGAGDPLGAGDLALGGYDVQRILCIPPGAAVGEWMERMLAHVLLRPEDNTKKRLTELLLTWRGGEKPPPGVPASAADGNGGPSDLSIR